MRKMEIKQGFPRAGYRSHISYGIIFIYVKCITVIEELSKLVNNELKLFIRGDRIYSARLSYGHHDIFIMSEIIEITLTTKIQEKILKTH